MAAVAVGDQVTLEFHVMDALLEQAANYLVLLGVAAALLFRPQSGPELASVLAGALRASAA